MLVRCSITFWILSTLLASVSFAQPSHMSYQGRLILDGVPHQDAPGQPTSFKFAIICFGQDTWANSTTTGGVPDSSVQQEVQEGVFAFLLGGEQGMPALTPDLLCDDAVLRVWVDTGSGFTQLPDQTLSSSGYALLADAAERSVGGFSVGDDLGVGGNFNVQAESFFLGEVVAQGALTANTRLIVSGDAAIGTTAPGAGASLDVTDGFIWSHASDGAEQLTLALGRRSGSPAQNDPLYRFYTEDAGGAGRLEINTFRHGGNAFFTRGSPDGDQTMARLGGDDSSHFVDVYDRFAEAVNIRLDSNGSSYLNGGNVGIGTTTPLRELDVVGTVRADVFEVNGGSDLSERFDITDDQDLQPGMLVCIDAHTPGKLTVSRTAYDRTVAGVVSGAGSVQPGMVMGQEGTLADGEHPVALSGRVWTLCDAESSAIRAGDLLTTSSLRGHAMKADDDPRARGSVIGKAMSPLESGRGLVLVLVNLQ